MNKVIYGEKILLPDCNTLASRQRDNGQNSSGKKNEFNWSDKPRLGLIQVVKKNLKKDSSV